MRVEKFRRIGTAGIFAIIIFFVTACAEKPVFPSSVAREVHRFPVDTTFKEFYETLGGEALLGPAISPLEIRDNLQCQFTENVLMCFNPAATGVGRFQLFPLGMEMKIQEDPRVGNEAGSPESRLVDGIVVYEKFLPLYDRLYGSRYVGRPLTELRINPDYQRAEQFFENVGFYQKLGDPNGPVYLIPYGAYLCGGECSYRTAEYWSIVKANMVEQPFAANLTQLGGPAAFGSLMLKPRIAEDGNVEQVYANAVFYASPEDASQVRLRPLPLMLGYEVQPLAEMKSHDQLTFYEVQGGLGHNIPRPFDEFVKKHGGRDVSGQPISEVILISEKNIYQQCFENYCLVYDPAASDMMKVRMAPLGEEYIHRFPPPETVQITNMFSPEAISILVSSDRPNLNSSEYQYVRIMVRQKETGQPIERVEATLTLSAPNRPPVRFYLPPTDQNGMAVVEIPPQAGLENGTRLSYMVCLNLPSSQPICALDSYLIWNIE